MKRDIDPKKLEIINHVDGPLLVIAGPGAGKTMAIVERVVHLIGVCRVAPRINLRFDLHGEGGG